jgi:hypothetical protein
VAGPIAYATGLAMSGALASTSMVAYLSRGKELAELRNDLLTVLLPRLSNQPAPGRVPYLLSPVLFPTGPPSP